MLPTQFRIAVLLYAFIVQELLILDRDSLHYTSLTIQLILYLTKNAEFRRFETFQTQWGWMVISIITFQNKALFDN